jgi:hypothetical protein
MPASGRLGRSDTLKPPVYQLWVSLIPGPGWSGRSGRLPGPMVALAGIIRIGPNGPLSSSDAQVVAREGLRRSGDHRGQ